MVAIVAQIRASSRNQLFYLYRADQNRMEETIKKTHRGGPPFIYTFAKNSLSKLLLFVGSPSLPPSSAGPVATGNFFFLPKKKFTGGQEEPRAHFGGAYKKGASPPNNREEEASQGRRSHYLQSPTTPIIQLLKVLLSTVHPFLPHQSLIFSSASSPAAGLDCTI